MPAILVLLGSIVLVAGAHSAFLVNDTICLVMTPLVLDLVTRLKRDPVPYLLAVAMASNVGSTATITGNPQNIIIGRLSHIPYGSFAGALWPVGAVGLFLTALLIAFFTRARIAPESIRSVAQMLASASAAMNHRTALGVISHPAPPAATAVDAVPAWGNASSRPTRCVKAFGPRRPSEIAAIAGGKAASAMLIAVWATVTGMRAGNCDIASAP